MTGLHQDPTEVYDHGFKVELAGIIMCFSPPIQQAKSRWIVEFAQHSFTRG